MRLPRRASLTVLLATTTLLAPATSDAATHRAKPKPKRPSCTLKHAETVASSPFGRLLATHRETDELYGDSTELYACRTGSRPVLVEQAETSVSLDVGPVAFTRDYVAYSSSRADSACTKYMGPAPECFGGGLASYNTRTGKLRASASGPVAAVALSARGWLAWITVPDATGSRTVGAQDRQSTRVLDEGQVDRRSLKVTGTTVTWTRDGTKRSAPLG